MPMEKGFVKCSVCKLKTSEDEINAFGECTKDTCYGHFMRNLRKGDPPLFPETRKKKGWQNNPKAKSGKQWRNYSNVKKKDLATPLYDNEEELSKI